MGPMQINVETAILQYLDEQNACTIEEVFRALSHFTFNQIFSAIDRLSREGRVRLQHPTPCTYLITAARPGPRSPQSPSADPSGGRPVSGSMDSPG